MSKGPDQRPTVLIVDDLEDNRALMRVFLTKKHNCLVIEAEDGQEALKLALRESTALILMDIGLPKHDGLVVIEQMRKRQTAQRPNYCRHWLRFARLAPRSGKRRRHGLRH